MNRQHTLMTHDIEQREAALKRIIVDAGDTALRFFQPAKGEYELKGHQDILTEADTFVEKLVQTLLTWPSLDLILGEETASQPASAEPVGGGSIDGTANFARGIAHFACAWPGFATALPNWGRFITRSARSFIWRAVVITR
jgi:myo-inositol-1(or 4)-monophosphatase